MQQITKKQKTVKMQCEKNMQLCAQWRSAFPNCPFGPIYKNDHERKEVVYTYPAVQTHTKTSVPLSTSPSSTTMKSDRETYTKTVGPVYTDDRYVSEDLTFSAVQKTISTFFPPSTLTFLSTMQSDLETDAKTESISAMISTTTDGFTIVRKLETPNGFGTSLWSQEHLLVLSFGVGVFSFLIGMLIVYLLFWNRKHSQKSRETQRESVFLLNIGEHSETRDCPNGEQIEMEELGHFSRQSILANTEIDHSNKKGTSGMDGIQQRQPPEIIHCYEKKDNHKQSLEHI